MTARVALAVHAFHPRIGGSEAHVRWMARALRDRGFAPLVITPRRPGEPSRVDDIEVCPDTAAALACDAVFTYSVSELTLDVASRLRWARQRVPWLHHPCAVSGNGLALLQEADCIVALNQRDVELTELVCGSTRKVARIFPGAHGERRGRPGRFRPLVGGDFILWVGGWTHAKGARSVSERFAAFRERHPDPALKLVMFGAYGGDERPIRHPDVVTIEGNWADVPDAFADCLLLAFNSPPPPIGYDANPIVLLEAFLNGKTFVAQAGTPFLSEVPDLGFVVDDDEGWRRAVETLVFLPGKRRRLEAACRHAYATRYNLATMMGGFEAALRSLLPGAP